MKCLSTGQNESLFPQKDEFPSRHIGPRDTDIITMLDTLGFKVTSYTMVFIIYYRYIALFIMVR